MEDTAIFDAWVKRALDFDPASPNGTVANDTGIFDSVKDLVADAKAAVTGKDPRVTAKQTLMFSLLALADPAGATPEETVLLTSLRAAITKALGPAAPAQPALNSATAGIAKLQELIAKIRQRDPVAELASKNPGAATKAREAFGKFDGILGPAAVTPEAAKQAADDLALKKKAVDNAYAAFKAAKALPPDAKGRQDKIDKASADYQAAKTPADAAAAHMDAIIGRASLSKALSHGPLSGETGNPFPDPATAEKLIAAYSKDAVMADAAVTAASTAKFPGVIADNVGPMIDRAKGGFANARGRKFSSEEYSRSYGADLLKTGGAVGPEYFAGLSDYMASGAQFSADGPGKANGEPMAELAQKRSVKLAGKLIKPDGSIDVGSADAKTAVGDLLYHPQAMRDQTPAMAAHVLKTVKLFGDPVEGPKASG
ncbi:MAG: hypothetical protein M3N26_08345, partial [Pseudomonadota bacterium]|nr:hypothetical protein [Pseudomonadota bacterium]